MVMSKIHISDRVLIKGLYRIWAFSVEFILRDAKRLLAYMGRLLISIIFIYGGLHYTSDWGERVGTLYREALASWQFNLGYWGATDNIFGKLIPHTMFLSMVGGILQLVGAACLFFNVFIRIGSLLLISYIIPNMLFFYPFWFFDGSTLRGMEFGFLNEIALLGVLLVILAVGKGDRGRAWRLFRRERTSEEVDPEESD